jgi:hypothetical protein
LQDLTQPVSRRKQTSETRRKTPEERAERLKREREFRDILERRHALDEKLAAERRGAL